MLAASGPVKLVKEANLSQASLRAVTVVVASSTMLRMLEDAI